MPRRDPGGRRVSVERSVLKLGDQTKEPSGILYGLDLVGAS